MFKKGSPNGKITVYLGKRDFVDHVTHVDPIDGEVKICNGDDDDDDDDDGGCDCDCDGDGDGDDYDDDFVASVELCVNCPSWAMVTPWWTKPNRQQTNY